MIRRLILAASAAALLCGPASAPALAQDDPVVAQQGDVTLTAGAIRDMVRFADPALRQKLDTDPAALGLLVRDRVLQLSVLARAKASNFDQRPDVAWRADRAREAVITDAFVASVTQPDPSYPSAADVQSAYEANKAKLVIPRQYRLSQIFVAVPVDAAKSADDAARAKAADARAQAVRARADFAAIARKASEDSATAAKGGDLGWLREDQLVPAVRSVVSGLSEGAVSDPVRAADGWHVLKLDGTRPAGPVPLDTVRDRLAQVLRQQKQQDLAQAYLTDLQKATPLRINEIEIGKLLVK